MEEFIKKMKKKLKEEKLLIEKELEGIAKKDDTNDWHANFPKFEKERLEEAVDEVEEYSSLVPISESLEQRLNKVDIALSKIERGVYGVCENCKKNISKKRLEAHPSASACRECQK